MPTTHLPLFQTLPPDAVQVARVAGSVRWLRPSQPASTDPGLDNVRLICPNDERLPSGIGRLHPNKLSGLDIILWSRAVIADRVTVFAVKRLLKTVPVPNIDWDRIIGLTVLGALRFSLSGELIPSRVSQATLNKALL